MNVKVEAQLDEHISQIEADLPFSFAIFIDEVEEFRSPFMQGLKSLFN